jgi:hypothetical protein
MCLADLSQAEAAAAIGNDGSCIQVKRFAADVSKMQDCEHGGCTCARMRPRSRRYVHVYGVSKASVRVSAHRSMQRLRLRDEMNRSRIAGYCRQPSALRIYS